MASIRKIGETWKAEVVKRVAGQVVRKSARFSTKAEARNWASQIEADLSAGKTGAVRDKSVSDILSEYRDTVAPTHKGEKWEVVRLNLILRDDLAKVPLEELNQTHIAQWRDRRLTKVSPASVRREWNLLSSAFTIAAKEWRWIPANPMQEVKRPAPPASRDRLFTQDEIDRLIAVMNYRTDAPPETSTARVCAAMLFAIETGMRAGEIVALTWSDIAETVATVREGKTAAAARRVPLTVEAQRLLAQLPKDKPTCFEVSTSQIDSLFRKSKKKALIEGLHFHDTRATAITRLAAKINILDLARMVGHQDLRMLQVYYRDSAESIAQKLAT